MRSQYQFFVPLVLMALVLADAPALGSGGAFVYGVVSDPIVSATFSMDVAELTAHEFVAATQVNLVHLLDINGGLPDADLSGLLFGGTSYPAAATIDLPPTQTGVISAPISPGFFPALASGSLGLWATLTDTRDGVFAIDTLTLTITTTTGTISSYYGSPNDGYLIGVPDNGNLPLALPAGLIATGTGFDEPVGSKSIYKVPEPGGFTLLVVIAICLLFGSRQMRNTASRAPAAPRRRRVGLVIGAGLLINGPAMADMRINEIMYAENTGDPNNAVEWVELFNAGPGSVNLAGWSISNRGGLSGSLYFRSLPAWSMPPASYLVVYFGSGIDDSDFTDGKGSYHTGDPLGINFYSSTMDEAGLYSPGGVEDFLAWRPGGKNYIPGQAALDAVAAAKWTFGRFVNSSKISHGRGEKFRMVLPGHSLGRDAQSDDTDEPEDWDVDGGAAEATPGLEDFVVLPFIPQDEGAYPGDPSDPNDPNSVTHKKWTLMLYMDADNNLEEFMYGDVMELQDAGGTNADINVVVLFDGLDGSIEGTIDANGDIDGLDPLTFGNTWRFEVGPPPPGGQDYILMRTHNGDNPNLGELNMGDPVTLTDFINWSKEHYPADRYSLFINDHGDGWKGCTSDDSTAQTFGVDALYMGEIRSALAAAGLHFDLVAFDECLMGMIEVAYQVEEHASYFVGSQELVSGYGYPYDDVLTDLKANPGWDGGGLGNDIVDQFHAFYQQPNPIDPTEVLDADHTLTCVDETALIALVQAVDGMAGDLKLGCDDFQEHDDPADNVEELIRQDAVDREIFGAQPTGIPDDPNDPNSVLVAIMVFSEFDYMDLCRFAENIVADPDIPECYKDHARVVAGETTGECLMGAIVNHEHGDNHPEAHGLNIYFPPVRTTDDPGTPQIDKISDGTPGDPDDPPVYLAYFPYDYPEFSRETDGDSQRAMYAENVDCLPKKGRDVETGLPIPAPAHWPLVPALSFRFPTDTQWDEFLQRFYHPVADNHILQGFCPCGQSVLPVINDPECGNPVDEITILCGWFVQFSAQGSSDADTDDLLPRHWMWDFDDKTKGCGVCLAPYELAPGDDASDADDDMNAEHDCNKAPLDDEKEDDADVTVHQYNLPGDYVVNLNVWDDNHEFSFHDTNPSAEYVHPQTWNHKSIVHVICPDQLHVVGPYPNTPTVGSATLTQAFVEDNFVGQANAPVVFTVLMGNATFLNGSGAGGTTTTLLTDGSGVAGVMYQGNSPGTCLIQVDVPGMPLTAFIFLEFTPARPFEIPTLPIPVKGESHGVGMGVQEP